MLKFGKGVVKSRIDHIYCSNPAVDPVRAWLSAHESEL